LLANGPDDGVERFVSKLTPTGGAARSPIISNIRHSTAKPPTHPSASVNVQRF